ncbi:MAG: hypothetical protein PHP38_11715 [Sphaerochaetaceae bacterium]|nr:hypothetical protein [Sphaerochaetaceae bacterium]MDD4763347.1 hypothetical protein [Sphaerochaetaceae bacterium]
MKQCIRTVTAWKLLTHEYRALLEQPSSLITSFAVIFPDVYCSTYASFVSLS